MATHPTFQDNWQPKLCNIVERTTHLFNNPDMSDVSFIFETDEGSPVKIYAHKMFLGMSSPVFHKLFYNDQFSTSMDKNREIVMAVDKYAFNSIAFLNFMKFLYTDNIPWTDLSDGNIIGFLHCAEFYDVPRLKSEAIKELVKKLNSDNAILLLETALLFNDNYLEVKSLQVIDRSARTVLKSEAILDVNSEILFKIIKRSRLAIEESPVLLVCLKWAMKECERKGVAPTPVNTRQVLGKIFFEIRFPILPSILIAQLVRRNILTQKESLDMLLNLHCAKDIVNDENKGLIPKSPFKAEKRAEPRKKLTAVKTQLVRICILVCLNDLEITLITNQINQIINQIVEPNSKIP